jgi:hypothetical protein
MDTASAPASQLNNQRARFDAAVKGGIEAFLGTDLAASIDAGRFTLADYHRLLLILFHQTFRAPQSFALAGAMMADQHIDARNYLIQHAADEHLHWQWILNDLKSTGFTGDDPRLSVPPPACVAYISFNYFIALQVPVARLAIASVLEGMAASHSKIYAGKAARLLALKPNQMQFYLGHSDTDVVHARELHEVIDSCELSESEWKWMEVAAITAGRLYCAMVNESVLAPT